MTAAKVSQDAELVVPENEDAAVLEHRDELTARAESYARTACC